MSAMNDVFQSEVGQTIKEILEAAYKHENDTLQTCLNAYSFPDCESVDVLDPSTNRCPLHLAILGSADSQSNGDSSHDKSQEGKEEEGANTVRLLLENGAIWNQLDKNDETPGCLARRLDLDFLYQLMVDAGVRAEVLLNRLEGYEQLGEDEDEEDAANGEENATEQPTESANTRGSVPELVITDVNSNDYLSSKLSLTKNKLLDDQSNGVMMEWERDIMERSATAIVDRPGSKVMNIGAGMLIFDTIVQASENKPESHHIVEAHPDVLADMRTNGWYEKPGVVIHEGRWQDVLPDLVAEGHTFDAIYFDTFAESYSQFREFFQEQLIGLLEQDGKWSFFNGMGADRQISYDVYQKVVELDLLEAGFDIEWETMDVPVLEKEWEGVKRKYWNVDTYRLPVCKFMG